MLNIWDKKMIQRTYGITTPHVFEINWYVCAVMPRSKFHGNQFGAYRSTTYGHLLLTLSTRINPSRHEASRRPPAYAIRSVHIYSHPTTSQALAKMQHLEKETDCSWYWYHRRHSLLSPRQCKSEKSLLECSPLGLVSELGSEWVPELGSECHENASWGHMAHGKYQPNDMYICMNYRTWH